MLMVFTTLWPAATRQNIDDATVILQRSIINNRRAHLFGDAILMAMVAGDSAQQKTLYSAGISAMLSSLLMPATLPAFCARSVMTSPLFSISFLRIITHPYVITSAYSANTLLPSAMFCYFAEHRCRHEPKANKYTLAWLAFISQLRCFYKEKYAFLCFICTEGQKSIN